MKLPQNARKVGDVTLLLKVSTSVIHVNTLISTHLQTPEGWPLAWLADLWRTVYLQSGHLSSVNHRSDTSHGKSTGQRPTSDIL